MESMWDVLVWFSLLTLLYTYIGYPLLIYFLAICFEGYCWIFRKTSERKNTRDDKNGWPLVSVLIPAFNEENVIRKKVENTLELDYPKDRLQILIVSDGSTDQTNDMLASYGANEIEFVTMPERMGKTAVLNQVVPKLKGKIVVLSDASGLIQKEALKRLIAHFDDPRVGGVCGSYRFDTDDSSLRGITEKFYWRYETFLKECESRVHSSIGAHGAFYGFRRALFKPLSKKAINDDFILPMQIIRKGYRVLYEPQATVEEHATTSLVGEFHRRTRINVGNFQQIYMLRGLLKPKKGIVAFEFFSHKVIRAFSPFLILLLPFACLGASSAFSDFLLKMQVIFYLAGLLGFLQEYLGLRIKSLYLPFYFLAGNVSAVIGFFKFIFRKQKLLWEKV